MAPRSLVVFEHKDALGNAPAHELQSRVTAKLKDDGAAPRSIEDYELAINDSDLPTGITIQRKI